MRYELRDYQRELVAALPIAGEDVDPEDALAWLENLGELWDRTTDEGRRRRMA